MCGRIKILDRPLVVGEGRVLRCKTTSGVQELPLSSHRFARVERGWLDRNKPVVLLGVQGFWEGPKYFQLPTGMEILGVEHWQQRKDVVSIVTCGWHWVTSHVTNQDKRDFYRSVFAVHHRCPLLRG